MTYFVLLASSSDYAARSAEVADVVAVIDWNESNPDFPDMADFGPCKAILVHSSSSALHQRRPEGWDLRMYGPDLTGLDPVADALLAAIG